MDLKERESWFKNFIELESKGIVDFIAYLCIDEDKEEILAYDSLEFNDDSLADHLIQQFSEYNIDKGFTLRLTYLPFSKEPITVQFVIAKYQIEQLIAFGIDPLSIVIKATLEELRYYIIKRSKIENPSNTYRELNDILYGT